MPRRGIGFLLIGCVLSAALVGARLGGTPVAGAAGASPAWQRPTVGDCLARMNPAALGAIIPPLSVTSVPDAVIRIEDCAAPHNGEVVALRTMPVTAPTDRSAAQRCRDVAAGYRSHDREVQSVADSWVLATGQRFMSILSSPSSNTGGAPWAACALVSPNFEDYRGVLPCLDQSLSAYIPELSAGTAPAPFRGVPHLDVESQAVVVRRAGPNSGHRNDDDQRAAEPESHVFMSGADPDGDRFARHHGRVAACGSRCRRRPTRTGMGRETRRSLHSARYQRPITANLVAP